MPTGARIAYRPSATVLVVLLLLATSYSSPLSASSPPEVLEPPPSASPGTDVPADWWAGVQADIQRAEYDITWQDQTYLADLAAAYQAPSRAQGLRTYFAPAGPIVIPREWPEGATSSPWRFGLRLDSWGREGAVQDAPAAALDVQGNRIEYRRGSLLEWYRNDPEGLALGLRLDAAPGGELSVPLRLTLAWDADLTAQNGDGAGVTFSGPDGVVALRLGSLTALDAAGRPLDAEVSVVGERLVLTVDEAGAAYPVEVGAVMTGPDGATGTLGATGLSPVPSWNILWAGAGASFGFSVGTAGDVNKDGNSDIIVGASRYDGGQTDEGRALVYLGHGGGAVPTYIWSQEADQAGARFGYSVGTAGDVNGDGFADVIVGAPNWNSSTLLEEADEGGAWVYEGSFAGPHTVPDFLAQSNQANANLGVSVAFAGNVNGDGYSDIIVGARSYNAGTVGEGIALVWHGSAAGVNGAANGTYENANWRAEGNQTSALLGSSVATAGDVNADGYADVVVGGFQYGADDAGAAWVWHGSSNGVNADVDGTPANAVWQALGPGAGAHLGLAVSTAGDVNGDGYADVVVGAPHYANGSLEEGAAYVYLGSGDGVLDEPDNTDEGNSSGAWFGYSVACAGDVNGDGYADVVVGAPGYTNTLAEQGRAFLWYGSASGISETRDWWEEGEVATGWYGNSVATAGDMTGDGYSDVIVGAPGTEATSSAVYVYYGGPDMPAATANWIKRSNQEAAGFGWSVGTAGDVNADGFADIIVGAPYWDAGQTDEGGAWIYRGAAGGLVSAPYWYKQSDTVSALFGWSVGTAGDVNGDGYADVIVGAPTWSNDTDEPSEGGAWVYHGSSTGVSITPAWSKDSDQAGAQFGYAVATAGDVNDDGYGDVIVGAPLMQYGAGEGDEGIAWLYLGAAGGLTTAPAWHVQGGQAGALLGSAVATAGDVDGDGHSDVLVGAPLWEDDVTVTAEGRVWLYMGTGGGLAPTAAWHAESNTFSAQMGYAVASAGDVNGDGYSDVIVGAPYWAQEGHSGEGKVWVFHGSAAGLSSTHAWTAHSTQDNAYYGWSVGTAGDVNGDGYADVLIGAPHMTGATVQADEGLVRLYLGGSGGLATTYAWTSEGDQVLAWHGISVGTAGDVNGDGYADIVVGAKDYTDVMTDEGRTLVYYGNGRSGTAFALRQYNESSHPLAQLGHSDSNAFRPALLRRSPFGRGQMATYLEVKPLGIAFTGRDYTWEGYWANPILGSNLMLTIRDLQWGTTYHWRVRVRYNPTTTPWMPASRWVTMPWNGWNEEDFRTPGTRVFLPAVLRNR